MTRDILFIVRGIPKEYRFIDSHYFMATPIPEVLKQLEAVAKRQFPELEHFLKRSTEEPIAFIGFRNQIEKEDSSVKDAANKLAGIIDGLSFFLNDVPAISDVVQIREEFGKDIKLCRFYQNKWIDLAPKDPASKINWDERTQAMFKHLLPFFNASAGIEPGYDNDPFRLHAAGWYPTA